MAQETKKFYCGNGKFIVNGKGLKMGLCIDRIPAEFITKSKNGERWVNLVAWINSEPDKFGNDASVQVDTYKPEAKQKENAPEVSEGNSNSLPF